MSKSNTKTNSKSNSKLSKKEISKKTNEGNKRLFYIIGGMVVIAIIAVIAFLLINGKSNDDKKSSSNQNSNSNQSNTNNSADITLNGYTIEKVDGYDMSKTTVMGKEILEIYKEGNEGAYQLFDVVVETKPYSEYKDNLDSLKKEIEEQQEGKVWDIQYRTYQDLEYMVISVGDSDKTYYQMLAYAKLSDTETFYITGLRLETTENDERYVEDYDIFSEIATILATAKK